MNETFIEQLACAFRKVGTIHTVGEEWHSYTGEIPVGGVPYLGHLVTRETYSALFAYAEAKGLVKTEAEWMELSAANNGNVPFYSDGDGSTTFRMPKIVGYFRGASTLAETGSYVAEGLPNITGEFNSYWKSASPVWTDTNAFDKKSEGDGHTIATTTTLNNDIITFDASRSNPIYGNSTHVIPETSVVLFGVYAFGAFCNVEDLDATKLSTAVANVEAQLTNCLPLSGGNLTGNLTVKDMNVVRSVNNKSADDNGNVSFTNLPSPEIPANADLNDYKTEGEYNCPRSDNAATLSNSPTTSAFTLTVLKCATNQQILRVYHGHGVWIRTYQSWNDTWTDWVKVGKKFGSYYRVNKSFTAPSDGFYLAYSEGLGEGNMYVTITVNGTKIAQTNGYHNRETQGACVPVKQGDNIACSGTSHQYFMEA